MRFLGPTLLLLTLLLLTLSLSSCDSSPTASPNIENVSADKRPTHTPFVEPAFLLSVEAAYDNILWSSVSVTVDLAGDEVSVCPADWPDSRPFIIKVPYTDIPRLKRTFRIEYPISTISGNVPNIPGDVTMYQFYNLPPDIYGMTFLLPPAPWYNDNLFSDSSCTYTIERNSEGSPYIAQTMMTPGTQYENSSVFNLPVAKADKPDEPARWLLEPAEPGPSDDPDDQ